MVLFVLQHMYRVSGHGPAYPPANVPYRRSLLILCELIAIFLMTSAAAFADTISDQLLVTLPDMPTQIFNITETDEINVAPRMALVSFTFNPGVHGAYCVSSNCQPGQSNVSFFDRGIVSDVLIAKLVVSAQNVDTITITLSSDSDAGNGGTDMGEFFDATNTLFTSHPPGFSVAAASDVPEPSSLSLAAVALCALLTIRQIVRCRIRSSN